MLEIFRATLPINLLLKATDAAGLKSLKTGKPMPFYMVNVIPREKFSEIHIMNEL